jgi:hypothetical protein
MIKEITYGPADYKKGKCTSCGEMSDEILIGDGRCIDCIEAERFYEDTMKGIGTQRSPFDIDS